MRPVSFGESFGLLHEATGDCGLVFCGTQGFEQFCIRAAWRRFADEAAAQGFPVLRFDYPHEGDSPGDAQEGPFFDAWRVSLVEAIACLRRETGVEKVVLVGLRLGALLALDHAARIGDVDGLVLLAPVTSGRHYLRETMAFASLMRDASVARVAAPGIDVMGFPLDDAAVAELKALKAPVPTRVPRVLVLTPPLSGAADALLADLRAQGADAREEPFEDYASFNCDPIRSRYPAPALARVFDWLGPAVSVDAPPLVLTNSGHVQGSGFTEEACRFGPQKGLFGVLCQPADRQAKRAVLILNAGVNPHMGWARQNVELARGLARAGIASLRFDLAGIGDSPRVAGRPDVVPYAMDNLADVRAALDLLEKRGYREVTALGSCSGAHLAFHAAVAEPRLTQIVMVNLLAFVWDDSFDLVLDPGIGRSATAYAGRFTRGDTWLRLLRGEVQIRSTLRAILAIGQRAVGSYISLLHPQGAVRRVRSWFDALAARGVRMHFVVSDGDPSIDVIRRHLGSSRLARAARVSTLPDTDHNLTQSAARQRLCDLVIASQA